MHHQGLRDYSSDGDGRNSFQVRNVRLDLFDDRLARLGRDAGLSLRLLPGHPVTFPNMRVQIAHTGASVATNWTTERLLTGVHSDKISSLSWRVRGGLYIPDVHGQLLLGDESLAALWTDVLPALIALVGLLTEVETTPSRANIYTLKFKLSLPSPPLPSPAILTNTNN